ncbi:hypothetical protein EIN_341500 [Entamoeba invadens IP1]|uniref:Uncharacterized protein n=1 Tax=Entamoeba invadens IP1 TaxID=370355 RepID=A0A0A1UE47_ENTIV|nr:hypothetical protein EIN_341500 [Entamoeba invadens IP1]ELP94762.1 hypothetical protein EIN_341500 [Entamoeba invadens IP1]|eukprot:XP_004261533.1 hypothetical protein EIN_341500 [Entamoeba invadens IP1]
MDFIKCPTAILWIHINSRPPQITQDLSTSFEKLFWNEEKGYFVQFNTKLEYGLARYPQDSYFYSSKWNIGGKEAGEVSPPWGIVTMFMSWAELLNNEFDNHAGIVKERLNWMIKHTRNDYMPCGEAVD